MALERINALQRLVNVLSKPRQNCETHLSRPAIGERTHWCKCYLHLEMRGSKIIAFSWTELARTILEECHPVRSGFRECELFVALTKAIGLLNINRPEPYWSREVDR